MKKQTPLTLTPSLQGDLDSLCGLYSVINALFWLYGHSIRRKPLFRALVCHLSELVPIEECLTQGMDSPLIDKLLSFLEHSYYRRYPVTIMKPFQHLTHLATTKILKQCDQWLFQRKDRVVLISDQYHWSVVTQMDNDWLYFFDSYKYQRISLRGFSLRAQTGKHQLFKEAIYFIERGKTEHDNV
jgi:hypothetical protein